MCRGLRVSTWRLHSHSGIQLSSNAQQSSSRFSHTKAKTGFHDLSKYYICLMIFSRFVAAVSHLKTDCTHSKRNRCFNELKYQETKNNNWNGHKMFLGEGQTSHGWFWTLLGRVRPRPAHCSVFTHCKEDSRTYIMCRFYTFFYTFWCSTGDLNKEISKWIQCLFWFHFVEAFCFIKTFFTSTDLWVIACCYKPVNKMVLK